MKFLNVLKTFRLNLMEGVIREFEAGLHEVEDDIADHWYVKANSEPLTTKQGKALQAAAASSTTAETVVPAQEEQSTNSEPLTTDIPESGQQPSAGA